MPKGIRRKDQQPLIDAKDLKPKRRKKKHKGREVRSEAPSNYMPRSSGQRMPAVPPENGLYPDQFLDGRSVVPVRPTRRLQPLNYFPQMPHDVQPHREQQLERSHPSYSEVSSGRQPIPEWMRSRVAPIQQSLMKEEKSIKRPSKEEKKVIEEKAEKKAKRIRDAKLGVSGALAVGAVAGVGGWLMSPVDKTRTFQPEFGQTEEEEYAIFEQLLNPYNVKDASGEHVLSDAERHKALLILMQDRINENVSYGFDEDTEGVNEYAATPSEIYADGGQGIDCEDYSVLCGRWTEMAKSEGLIPEDVKTYQLYVNTPDGDSGHSIFVYEVPGNPPERYVIDTFTSGREDETVFEDLIDGPGIDSNSDGIVSFNEYFEGTDFELVDVGGGRALNMTYDVTNPGKYSKTFIDIDDFLAGSSGSNTVGDSVTVQDIIDRQADWIDANGEPGLPADFNATDYENELELITAQQILGRWHHDTDLDRGMDRLTADDLGLTDEQRVALIGRFSQHYGREFTAEDVGLDPDDPIIQLAGVDVEAASAADGTHVARETLVEAIDEKSEELIEQIEVAAGQSERVDAVSGQVEEAADALVAGVESASESAPESFGQTVVSGLEGAFDAASVGMSVASGTVEGIILSAMAQYKLYKLNKRRESTAKAFDIQGHREKALLKALPGKLLPPVYSTDETGRIRDEQVLKLQSVLAQHNKDLSKEALTQLIRDIDAIAKPEGKGLIDLTKKLSGMGISLKKSDVGNQYAKIMIDSDKLHDYLQVNGADLSNIIERVNETQPMTRAQFADYAKLCFLTSDADKLEKSTEEKALLTLFKNNDQLVDKNGVMQTISAVYVLDKKIDEKGHGGLLTRNDRHLLAEFRQDIEKSEKFSSDLGASYNQVDELREAMEKESLFQDSAVEISQEERGEVLTQYDEKINSMLDKLEEASNDPIVSGAEEVKEKIKNIRKSLRKNPNDKIAYLKSEVLKEVMGVFTDIYSKGNTLKNKKKLDALNRVLGKLDVKIAYNTDKLFGSVRDSASAIGHTVSVKLDHLHDRLKGKGIRLPVSALDSMIASHHDDITALYKLRDYDQWKVSQRKRDRNIKVSSAAVGFVPVVPEVIKAAAYGKEVAYRKSNQRVMNDRLSSVQEALSSGKDELRKAGWNESEITQFKTLLANGQTVKNKHMRIKQARDQVNTGTHIVAAPLDLISAVPVIGHVVTGVKAGTKISTAMAAAFYRKYSDRQLKQEKRYNDINDIYGCLKKLYLKAKSEGRQEKMQSIAQKAQQVFDIQPDEFQVLVKTALVENKLFKPSVSHLFVR